MKRARQECPVKTWLESSAKMRLPARDGSYLHTLVVHQLPLGFSGSADHCNEPVSQFTFKNPFDYSIH